MIVFIDSDLVVTKDFLREHSVALSQAHVEYQDDCTFTYGRVVNTANFENPTSEKFKLTVRLLNLLIYLCHEFFNGSTIHHSSAEFDRLIKTLCVAFIALT